MADRSAIEWTETTWNPVTGCTRISEGCDHCYIERTPPFRIAERLFNEPGVGGTTGVTRHPERLDQPSHWRKPRLVFVNSLSDLFHRDVPDSFIVKVFDAMGNAPEHTFQVLTKRPGRMRAFVAKYVAGGFGEPGRGGCGPLSNVWLGVSVESQRWADIRIPILLDTPAAVRWLSCEPLLGPVDLYRHLFPTPCPRGCGCRWPEDADSRECACDGPCCTGTWNPKAGIGWVVVGGESGPGARPMHPDWARDLRDQCTAAEIPFFFKQWGEWLPLRGHREYLDLPAAKVDRDWDRPFGDDVTMCRVGKRAAGRHLDGRTWDELPQPWPRRGDK